ncbi:MAG: DUF6612 family protein [Anaerovoracaceae bacterium]
MKKNSKFLAMALIICLIASFSACGEKSTNDADVMKAAMENMEALNSLTAETSMDMVMSMDDEIMSMTSEMTQKVINEPLAMEMIMDMVMQIGGESQKMQSKVYAEAEGDNLITYTEVDGQWYKMTQPGLEAMKDYDSTASMATYLEAIQNFKKVDTEEVAGVKADKYEGVITEEYFQRILDESGVGEQLGLDGADAETLKQLFEGIGEMPIAIWVDGERLLPVKYDFDMTEMMSSMMENMGAAEAGLSIDKVTVSMTFTGYDNVDKIDIPQEARDAEELEVEE